MKKKKKKNYANKQVYIDYILVVESEKKREEEPERERTIRTKSQFYDHCLWNRTNSPLDEKER